MTQTVVALGDSISAGVGDAVGPGCAHGPGWAAHLATLLGAGAFHNVARNGARARDVVDVQLPRALDLRPRVATLVVGGNDALRSDFCAASVARDLSVAVGAMRDVGAAVVLATLPPIGLFELAPAPVRRVMRGRIDAVNAAVRHVAAGAGADAVVLDVGAAVRAAGPGAWHVDRVHPSPLGHRAIALEAARALQPQLVGEPYRGPHQPDLDGAGVAALLPPPPAPPSVGVRLAWLALAGVPWALRRGRDFLPGLLRAVVEDLRAGVVHPPVVVGSPDERPVVTRAA